MGNFIKKIEIYSPKILSSKKVFILSDIHRTNKKGIIWRSPNTFRGSKERIRLTWI